MDVRAFATLKRLAPLIADSRPTKLGAKHRRTSSYSTPGSGGGSLSRRPPFFASGGDGGGGGGNAAATATAAGDKSRGGVREEEEDESDRLLREKVEGLALETERMRSSRERAASFAAADRRLDEEFLESFGVSLIGPGTAGGGGGEGGASPAAFDRERVTSLPLGSGAKDAERGEAEEREYKARRQKAAATLSAAEFKCWEIREEIDRLRRQEENMREQIFNGDPLLPLASESRGGDNGMEFGTSP